MGATLTGRTILVVQNEPLVASDILTAFNAAGAVTLVARTLAEARRLVEQDDVSAAVLDFGEAEEDGEQLCHRLVERNLPFVLHSGYSHPGAACREGISIPKPANPDALIGAVLKLLYAGRAPMTSPTMGGPLNAVLAALPSSDFAMLKPHLDPVQLNFRTRLECANKKVTNIYFPEAGLASIVALGFGKHRQAEVAVIGREGMTGLSVVLGADQSPCEIVMQIEGKGQRISADNLRAAMDQSVTLVRILLRFALLLAVQTECTALATARGNLDVRLARWLLMAQDRIDSDELVLTHELLASMLGVRRAGVSTALSDLHRKGILRTGRRAVIIKDRSEERRVGKECRCRRTPEHEQKNEKR